MEDKGEDFKSYRNIKARTLSPMKDKRKDVESYENIKTEDIESYER